jgi:hypothetical protein
LTSCLGHHLCKRCHKISRIGAPVHIAGALHTKASLSNLYPEGYVGAEHTFLFNHEDIDQVVFEGFIDDEHREFRERLAEFVDSEINNSIE